MHVLLTALVLLHGTITRGPTTPVCQVGKPCTAPMSGAVLVFTRNGVVAARARSDSHGHYSLRLRLGTYTVSMAVRPKIGSGVKPQTITLRRAVSTRIDFFVDTGIR
jgi:hypothetical protein